MNKFTEGYVNIDGIELRLTNFDKVFWPDEEYTKGDLIYYYYRIADYILSHLKDRPLTLKRYPNGIAGERFFQKDVAGQAPDWLETKTIYSPSTREHISYVICNNKATLIYLANLAAISQNPWLSHWPSLAQPDFFALDLDPSESVGFEQVIEVAHLVKEQLDKFNLKSWVKTTGATGLHIYVPIKPIYRYKEARSFARLIATIVSKQQPALATIEHNVKNRGGRVYIDYLQNVKGKTLASVYSVRAKPRAPVSTPLKWEELTSDIRPQQFTMFNIFERLKKQGDLFKPVLQTPQDLGQALKKM